MRGIDKLNSGLMWLAASARALAMTTALLLSSIGTAASSPTPVRAHVADTANQNCINFQDLAVGTQYGLNDTFVSNGTTLKARSFNFFTGNPVFGNVRIQNGNNAHGTGQEVALTLSDLGISFTQPISGLSILYGDFGSSVNLVINGVATSGANMSDMDGIVRDGVTVEVFEDSSTLFGRVLLRGDIRQIEIGGLNFMVDDICQLPPLQPRTLADLGDAPDSVNNHAGVAFNTAYPAVAGRFPTVWDGTPAGAGTGPKHLDPYVTFLGLSVSGEVEADQLPDNDGITNILQGGADNSDNDTRDDGWLNPGTRLNNCQTTILKIRVTRGLGVGVPLMFLNAWFDGNRDGDWADRDTCPNATPPNDPSYEWMIQNRPIPMAAILPGSYRDFNIFTNRVMNPTPGQPHWLRFTLAGQVAPAGANLPDGRGLDAPNAYLLGETEDYKQNLSEGPFPGTLAITKSAILPANPHGGDPVNYRIVLEHVGGSAAAITTLRDRLPADVSFVGPISVTAITRTVSPLNATLISGTVQWTGELEPGAKLRLVIPARINPCVGADKTITNVARAENTDGAIISDTSVFTVACSPPPNVDVHKSILRRDDINGALITTTDTSVLPHDDLVFRFTARNNGAEPAVVFVRDEMPAGLEAGGGDPLVGKGRLEVRPGLTATFDLRARVTAPCGIGRVITNVAQYTAVPGTAVQVSAFDLPPTLPRNPTNVVTLRLHCNDLGDAPDSTNHFGAAMAAYPAVQANYPTVFDPATGTDQGPVHRNPNPFHLGANFSIEADADVLPDQDGVRNIVPPANNPNNDVFDDSTLMSRIAFSDCTSTTIPVRVFIGPNAAAFFAAQVGNGQGYLNVWVDANRDGDWADVRECVTPNGSRPAFEHIVIDQQISLAALGAGLHTLNVPTGRVPWPSAAADKPAWLRVTLSEIPSNKTLVLNGVPYGDGRGFAVPFVTGETEDYVWRVITDTANGPDVTIRKRGAMRTDSGGPIIGTASSEDKVVWQIQYANLGNADATNVLVTDDLTEAGNKAGLTITTVPPVSYTLNANSLTFNVGNLASGASGNIMVELSRHLTQRIYTNTATITATNDIDAGNNTDQAAVRHAFLQPPILLNPLDGTTCDGDFTGNNTLLGITTEGATVDVYVDGVLTATVPAGGSGYFRHDMVLPDGEYTLYAVAHLNGHDSVGESRIVIVDSSLTWDPLSLRFIDSLNRRFRPTDADSRTDEIGWVPHLSLNTTYTVSVRVCCDSPIASVSLDVSGTAILLSDPDGDRVFQGIYTTPSTSLTSIPFGLTVDCNGAITAVPANILIDPAGVVYDIGTGAKLGNTSVVCMLQNPEDSSSYNVWPAADFGQTNPLITGADGAFSFLTPVGTYRLDVSRSGYQPYRSPDLQVVDVPVHIDVPLTPAIAEPATLTITIGSNGYTPALATVTPGTVIVFVNVDVEDHHVRSRRLDNAAAGVQSVDQNNGFDSGVLGPNQSYKVKLSSVGTIAYTDGTNAELGGAIQVAAAGGGNRVLMPLIQR